MEDDGKGRASDYKPISSEADLDRFINNSTVYKDFRGEIGVRIEDLRDALEEADGKKFHAAQGAVKLMRQLENLFEDLIENRRADLREEAQDSEEKNNG